MDPVDVSFGQLHRLSVCPHDSATRQFGWFLLNTHLQRRLGIRMHFEPHDDILGERDSVLGGGFDLVYANAFSAVLFARHLGFEPVARPADVYDETCLVVRDDLAQLPSRPVVASATDRLIVHGLGMRLLPAVGVDPRSIDTLYTGTHLAAVKAVADSRADLAFVFGETWDSLSAVTTHGLRVAARGGAGEAFHVLMAGAQLASRTDDLREIMVGLRDTEVGRDVLAELGFSGGFVPVRAADLGSFEHLVGD